MIRYNPLFQLPVYILSTSDEFLFDSIIMDITGFMVRNLELGRITPEGLTEQKTKKVHETLCSDIGERIRFFFFSPAYFSGFYCVSQEVFI